MTRKQIFTGFFIAIFLFLIYLFYQILKPFLFSLFWAGIFSLVLYPIYERLTKLLRNKSAISSLLMTLITFCIFVIPLFLITSSLAIEMIDIYKTVQSKGEFEKLTDLLNKLNEFSTLKAIIPSSIIQFLEKSFNISNINLHAIALKSIGSSSKYLLNLIQNLAGNLTSFLFNFVIMIFALFFFFRDGKKIYREFLYLIPMDESQKDKISKIFSDTIDGVILGSVVIAILQGLLIGLMFWILGISYPMLSGALSFLLSFLPAVGAAIVWFPVGIYLLLTGSIIKGIILLLFGFLILSTIDNIIRPLIIGGKVKLPTLFLFLSIIGGIHVFGFSGIVLGPVIVAVFISFIEIYKQTYKELA